MEIIDILKTAISLKKPISYEYVAENRVIGVRYGNPHAIFIATTGNVNIDIYKTGGVSSDETKPLPGWRQYKLKHIVNVIINEDLPEFEIASGYNPNSRQYSRVIAKI